MLFLLSLGLLLFGIGCTTDDDGGSDYDEDAIIIDTNITSPIPWDGGTVYVIEGSITVSSTLTIPAGTIIKFTAGSAMETDASGVINASTGTATIPIISTSIKDDTVGGDTNLDGTASSPGRRDWNEVFIGGNGSSFNYCEFYYGGGGADHTLKVDVVSAIVFNCTFAHNDGTLYGALDLGNAVAGTVVTGNRFYDNVVPLMICPLFSVDASNSFSNVGATIFNTRNGIFVSNYGPGGTVTGNITWSETDVAYVINGYLQINAGNSLSLAANVVLKFVSPTNGYIAYWPGTLLQSPPVLYTSYQDDTRKGDTNADSNATSPGASDWLGIWDDNASAYVTGWGSIFYAANSN